MNRNQESSNKEKNSFSNARLLPVCLLKRDCQISSRWAPLVYRLCVTFKHSWWVQKEFERMCKVLVMDYFKVLFWCLSGGAVRKHEKSESGYLSFGRRSEPGVSCVRSRVITLSTMVINEHIVNAGWLVYRERNLCNDSPHHLSQARFVVSKLSKMVQQQHWSYMFGGTQLEFQLVYWLFLLRISSFSSVPPPTKPIFLQCHDHLPLSPHLSISTLRCICKIAKHDC